MLKKIMIAALIAVPSVAFAMERIVECAIHPEESPVNGINEIRMRLDSPKKQDSIEIVRWAMTSSATRETYAVSGGRGPEFYWGEEEQVSYSSRGDVRDSVSLVRVKKGRGAASWALVKRRSTLIGGAGCIPNEDRGCRLDVAETERTAIVCSDSLDQMRSDPEAARRRKEKDPFHN